MLSQKMEYIFNLAIKRANERKMEFITLENILLSLLYDEDVTEVLKACGGSIEGLQSDLTLFMKVEAESSMLSDERIQELYEQQFYTDELKQMAKENGILYQPELTQALQRVIQRAAVHVQSAGKGRIQGVHVLVEM